MDHRSFIVIGAEPGEIAAQQIRAGFRVIDTRVENDVGESPVSALLVDIQNAGEV